MHHCLVCLHRVAVSVVALLDAAPINPASITISKLLLQLACVLHNHCSCKAHTNLSCSVFQDAVKASAKEASSKAGTKEGGGRAPTGKEGAGKAPAREGSTAPGASRDHKAPAKQGSRVQQELRQEVPCPDSLSSLWLLVQCFDV